MTAQEPQPMIDPRKPKELSRKCPIDIYLSGCDGGGYGSTYFPWAYRMNRPKELRQTYVDDSDVFIEDSGIHIDSITTEDVIQGALDYRPDRVIAADVFYEPEKTTERIYEFLDMIDDRGVEAEPIIPLQPSESGVADHVDHYRDVAGLSDHYAIGGVKDAPASVQRDAVESIREEVGDGVTLHGLGFGLKYFTDPRVLGNPLLDSIDCSTPIQRAREGEYWTLDENGDMVKQYHPKPSGTFSLLEIAMESGLTLISLARMVLLASEGDMDPEEITPEAIGGE